MRNVKTEMYISKSKIGLFSKTERGENENKKLWERR